MEIWQVITTLSNQEEAQRIASRLIIDRLAACVQIDGPIHSIYWWQDAVANEVEWRCTIKTTQTAVQACIAKLKSNHPYSVPEIIAQPIAHVDEEYAGWVAQQVTADS